jgi:hypothetical protein
MTNDVFAKPRVAKVALARTAEYVINEYRDGSDEDRKAIEAAFAKRGCHIVTPPPIDVKAVLAAAEPVCEPTTPSLPLEQTIAHFNRDQK